MSLGSTVRARSCTMPNRAARVRRAPLRLRASAPPSRARATYWHASSVQHLSTASHPAARARVAAVSSAPQNRHFGTLGPLQATTRLMTPRRHPRAAQRGQAALQTCGRGSSTRPSLPHRRPRASRWSCAGRPAGAAHEMVARGQLDARRRASNGCESAPDAPSRRRACPHHLAARRSCPRLERCGWKTLSQSRQRLMPHSEQNTAALLLVIVAQLPTISSDKCHGSLRGQGGRIRAHLTFVSRTIISFARLTGDGSPLAVDSMPHIHKAASASQLRGNASSAYRGRARASAARIDAARARAASVPVVAIRRAQPGRRGNRPERLGKHQVGQTDARLCSWPCSWPAASPGVGRRGRSRVALGSGARQDPQPRQDLERVVRRRRPTGRQRTPQPSAGSALPIAA